MPEQRLIDANDAGDRGKVLLLVIGELAFAVERRIDHEGAGFRHQQRVAVRSGLGHGLRADDMGGAALVFNDDLLAPGLGEPLADRPRHHVGHAAGGGGHRQRNGTRRIGGRLRRGRAAKACEREQRAKPFHHPLLAHGCAKSYSVG